MQIMRDWVEAESRVLDLGCGRGVLLDFLKQSLKVEALGVDSNQAKAHACVKRGLSVYMGDMMDFMKSFPDNHFDYVVCSRTLQELTEPALVIQEALRVSEHLLVGFVNFGYWRNRLSMMLNGRRVQNEVFPRSWWESRPTNPLSVTQFESFCRSSDIRIARRVCLGGNWRSETRRWVNLLSGYALYDLKR